MSLLKCKCCGGDLNVKEGDKVVTCPYCGSQQTIPDEKDEQVLKIYARGNRLRSQGEFDKAYSTYSQLLSEGKENAEVYWNLLLCKYGITYVDDYDGKKKPTMNRRSMTSILDDDDYKKAIELSDAVSKEVYEQEANKINDIQKGILKIVRKEEPYDIFVSYKETDEFGDRTKDSLLAQEIYDALTKEGYRVFLSRVTLSNVIGKEYEPYIYSALYTAKVMILVTTDEQHVNSVWVKNEWSRFVDRMKSDSSKTLIPCYRDRDPYDLPKELRNLQGLDRGKLGFIQDLKTGVEKILGKNKQSEKNESVRNTNGSYGTVDAKLDRCQLLIEAGQFDQAKELLDDLINEAPKNWRVYYYLLECKSGECSLFIDFDSDNDFKWFLKFCPDEKIKTEEKASLYYYLVVNYNTLCDFLSEDVKTLLRKNEPFKKEEIIDIAKRENQLILIANKLLELSQSDETYNRTFLRFLKDKDLPFHDGTWCEGYFDSSMQYPHVQVSEFFWSYPDYALVKDINMRAVKEIYLKNDCCFIVTDQLYVIYKPLKINLDGEHVDTKSKDFWWSLEEFILMFNVLKLKIFDFYYISDDGQVFDFKGNKVTSDKAKQVKVTIGDYSKQEEERKKQEEERKKIEEERKKQEEERKKQEEERKKLEEERKKKEKLELDAAIAYQERKKDNFVKIRLWIFLIIFGTLFLIGIVTCIAL